MCSVYGYEACSRENRESGNGDWGLRKGPISTRNVHGQYNLRGCTRIESVWRQNGLMYDRSIGERTDSGGYGEFQ